ncbi:MAG: GldG family protein [Candidatus Omnitrophica bacterium]|nr:GldG family protein [Candidatus Omnitrophota bacterium]
MAINKEYKNLWALLGAGAVCLIYGLGLSYVEDCFSKLTIIVSLAGLVCLGFCVFKLKKTMHRPVKSFPWRKYALKTIIIASSLIFVMGINYLCYRYNLHWDVTKFKQHTLTEETSSLIKELKSEVKIVVFHVGMPPKYLGDLLKGYERQSLGMVKGEIIDPIVQIGYAAQFGNVISGKEKKAIVSSGSERQDIDFTEHPLNEERLTNAIVRVTREKRRCYFITGHEEYDISDKADKGLSTLVKLLEANNVQAKKLMLGIKGEIPDDCDVLIIAGAQNPLTEKEEEIIKAYLDKGGDALFLIENMPLTTPDKPLTEEEKHKNPSLNSILSEWGVKIGDDIVVDLSNHISTDVGCPATRNYVPYPAIVKGLDYTFYVRPRSISILNDRRETVKCAPLVLTSNSGSSWGETDRTLVVKFDEGVDTPGPIAIAFMVMEPKAENKSSDTRIIVFTDADFLSNAFIGQYSNAAMGLNVIAWLSELGYQAFANQKEIKVERLDLTSKQKRMVAVVLFLMPVLIAISGIMVWVGQKSRIL